MAGTGLTRLTRAVAGLACVIAAGCGATAPRFEADLARWEGFGFSGAVLVARGDQVLSSRGYGLADREQGIPVTPDTLFDIASLGKQFTAAAIVKLSEEGRLAIREPIARVIPGVPEDKAAITIHHLLTHTAGISDLGDEDRPLTRDELIAGFLAAPLAEAPGSGFEYSNLGYNVLAAIVERVSGERFEDYLRHALFEPAGLRHTTFTWTCPPDARLALGYGGFVHPSAAEDPRERPDTWQRRGSGDVLSSVADLARWLRALRSGQVLAAESLELMFQAHTTAEADFLSYGYGWRIQDTEDGEALIWHSGLETPYSAMLRYYADEALLFVFLSNLSVGSVPLREVLARPSRSGPPSARLFPDALAAAPRYGMGGLERYRGDYKVGDGGRWTAEIDGAALVLRAEGQEALDALFPPADDSSAAEYERAGNAAVEMARCLVEAGCADGGLSKRIDPYGYSRRGAARLASDWGRHGVVRDVRHLGTTSVRGPRPRNLTQIRLVLDDGALDEHVLWYADDEIYWLSGLPATFTVRFRPAVDGGLVGFDLLAQAVYRAELDDDDRLVVEIGGRTTVATRNP